MGVPFRPYIDGYEFKVVTDHSSLRWLCQMKNPTSRLARWALELQGHKFTVEHRKGALNYRAEALSRMYEGEDGAEVAAVSWFTDTEDTWYQEWYAKVKEQPNDHPTYKLVAGNLYLGDDEYVRNCETCQRFNVEQRAPAGLNGRRVVERPWQVVAGDIIRLLPRTSKGFEYIVVFQDLFSRWAEASPIRKANSKAVVGELDRKVFLRFGWLDVFFSDNGTEFKNRAVEDFLKERGVHHTNTPTYHPQANPVEHANRTLKTMVASYLKERHTTWDEKLPELLFAMNSAVHSST